MIADSDEFTYSLVLHWETSTQSMSNIYIQEPPTSGKVSSNSIRKIFIANFDSIVMYSFGNCRCCWRLRPAILMWSYGLVRHQKHAVILCNCVWRDITMAQYSIAWSKGSLHKVVTRMATAPEVNRFMANHSKMNSIRDCGSHVVVWLHRPMEVAGTTMDRNSFSLWAKRWNCKVNTRFSVKSPATRFSTCSS